MAKIALYLSLLIVASCALSSQASFADKLQWMKQKISKVVDDGIAYVEEHMDEAKAYAAKMLEKTRQKALKATTKMHEQVNAAMKKVDDRLEELRITAKGVDISDCTETANKIRDTALTIIGKSSTCISKKIDECTEYVEGLVRLFDGTLSDLHQINNAAKKCDRKSEGFTSSLKALTCLGVVLKDATFIGSSRIPTILEEGSKLTTMVSTTIPSLAFCTTTGSISGLVTSSDVFLKSAEECVAKKIAEADKVTSATVAPPK